MLKVSRITVSRRSLRRACWGLAAVGVVAGLSCLSSGGSDTIWERPAERIVWPQPPEQPRLECLGAIGAITEGRRTGAALRLLAGRKSVAMVKPVAVAKNEAGLMAVVDPAVPMVYFFDLTANRSWTLKGKLSARLRSPVGVAVDAQGMVYVSDSVAGRVFVFERGRELVGEIGVGLLTRPTGLALNSAQDILYVVDTIANQVVAFDFEGTKLTSFGARGTGPGQFNYPTYIAAMPDGNICVSDSLNFRVQILRPDGAFVNSFGLAGDGAGSFARPKGVGADTAGRIYVVDAAFENVQVFRPDGTLLLAFGAAGTGLGGFSLPCGMFVDNTNTIWVADSFNNRVQVFRLLEDTQ